MVSQLGRVWAGNGEGGALGGQHPGWAGALLLFNHSPVTCPERETKAACPHLLYPRKGSRDAPWGGQEPGEPSLSPSGCKTRFLENFGGQLNPAG